MEKVTPTTDVRLRPMEKKDSSEVTDLICISLNMWYQTHGRPPIFPDGPKAAKIFCEEYEALDPGCCVIAENTRTGRLLGSCFYHPRETHVSLGIMNVHPNYFGQGIARKLLQFTTNLADRENKPLRLVSSAMNLDSFSLYTRAGFVPRCAFQDMYLAVPQKGLPHTLSESSLVRPATLGDIPAISAIEMEISHITRKKDYQYFIENKSGIWHISVIENPTQKGKLDGFLASVNSLGFNMIGPGVARVPQQAAALILAELNQNKGRQPVFLVPVDCRDLVQQMYSWGAKNCETHFSQVRGEFHGFHGVIMPSFMPETA